MKNYEGLRKDHAGIVTADGYPLNPRRDLVNHSFSGFDWGHDGAASAQLALALLADSLQERRHVLTLYQAFKWSTVVRLSYDHWTLSEDQIKHALRSAIVVLQTSTIQPVNLETSRSCLACWGNYGAMKPNPLFHTRYIVATTNALSRLTERDILTALHKHQTGDWGEYVDDDDRQDNENAIIEGKRIQSAYRSTKGTKFYIITEADRSCTAITLPVDC